MNLLGIVWVLERIIVCDPRHADNSGPAAPLQALVELENLGSPLRGDPTTNDFIEY